MRRNTPFKSDKQRKKVMSMYNVSNPKNVQVKTYVRQLKIGETNNYNLSFFKDEFSIDKIKEFIKEHPKSAEKILINIAI